MITVPNNQVRIRPSCAEQAAQSDNGHKPGFIGLSIALFCFTVALLWSACSALFTRKPKSK